MTTTETHESADAEFHAIVTVLHQVLRTRRVTYAVLAKKLAVSERTVKRLFSGQDCSLQRVLEICRAAEVPFASIVEQARSLHESTFSLTEAQEMCLAEDRVAYALFDALIMGEDLEVVARQGALHQSEVRRILRMLERAGLVNMERTGRVLPRFRGTHNWLPDGPLARAFGDAFLSDFLKEAAEQESTNRNCHFTLSERRVTAATLRFLSEQQRRLAEEMRRLATREETLFPREKLIPVKWVLAINEWEPLWVRILGERRGKASAGSRESRR